MLSSILLYLWAGLLTTYAVILVCLALHVLMKQMPISSTLAWLLLIFAVPLVGAVLYVLIGERRIGEGRARGITSLRTDYKKLAEAAIHQGLTAVDWSRHRAVARGMNQLGMTLLGTPTVRGSSLELLSDSEEILRAIAQDVDAAQTSVLMEFYIWSEGGCADEVLEALIRAARRGVNCRLLVDALGARPWWKGNQPGRLREAGVDVRPALPVGLFRTLVGRTDLRQHRKIVVIDAMTAWTGSMNMVDPRFFKRDAGVGQWVDAMVRVQGAAVVPLAATLIGDWILESGEVLGEVIQRTGLRLLQPRGSTDVQVVPSGPGLTEDCLLQLVLTLLHAAQNELVLTTPYLVPDESILRALRSAAARGVRVQLIVPEHVDSFLTRYASRSSFDDLLSSGVEIYLYRGGLLHTKSITVDGQLSMFGTANLDMRSLWLNYEISLFIYEAAFAAELGQLQQSYLNDSARLYADAWAQRSFGQRLLENIIRLVGPLL